MRPGFCRACGAALRREVPADDDRERLACPQCARIEYENPRVHAGCVLERDGGAVLCLGEQRPGERVQAAALRVAGGAAGDEARLALWCALTDLEAGAVCLLFRAAGGALRQSGIMVTAPMQPPPWAAGLLAAFEQDLRAGGWPVRTAEWKGGVLELAVVRPD